MKKKPAPGKRAPLNVRVLATAVYGGLFGRRSKSGIVQAMEAFGDAPEAERAYYATHLAFLQLLATSDVLRELRAIRALLEDAAEQLGVEEEEDEEVAAEGDASLLEEAEPAPAAPAAPQVQEVEVEDDIDGLLLDGFDAEGEE